MLFAWNTSYSFFVNLTINEDSRVFKFKMVNNHTANLLLYANETWLADRVALGTYLFHPLFHIKCYDALANKFALPRDVF